jgi:hypothetical protein
MIAALEKLPGQTILLNSLMHERGHAFGLPYTPDGIMQRGFDNVNRFFTAYECVGDNRLVCDEKHASGAYWHVDSAKILMDSFYFAVAKLDSHDEMASLKKSGKDLLVVDRPLQVWIQTGKDTIFRNDSLEDGIWVEYHGDKSFSSFKEVYRDETKMSILVHDAGRGMYNETVLWSTDQKTYHSLGQGQWKNKYQILHT